MDLITAAYSGAPGNEIASGKMASEESSSALVANAFGFFLGQPEALPPLPGTQPMGWPAETLGLEAIVRFPWSGGRHPCLDVLLATKSAVIGVESKRYEPFRTHSDPDLSEAYWRPLWGDQMAPFERLRDDIAAAKVSFVHLDAVQLIKHAFGLRTAVQTGKVHAGKKPILFYLYAEPMAWPSGKIIGEAARSLHEKEIEEFSTRVVDSEVAFKHCSYSALLAVWMAAGAQLQDHAAAVKARFNP